ncbi:MAG: anti-sigma F factor [Oscillospiraceae bacterium]
MKIINTLKMTILSHSINESFSRMSVAGFISQLDPTVEEVSDIKTAVSEAVTNSVVHGYKNIIGNIYIKVSIYDNNTVTITIKDKGVGIVDIEKAMEPLFTTDKESETAGLGFAVMESFMDKVKVKSKVDKGTTVVLSKKINKKSLA